jgi:hypothetical protein
LLDARPVEATLLLDRLWRQFHIGGAVRAATDTRRFTTNHGTDPVRPGRQPGGRNRVAAYAGSLLVLGPTVITEQDPAALAEGYPQLLAATGLDGGAVAELVGAARDAFTAACGDKVAGLHGPKHKPCPTRPRVCPLCPPAVFAPRHAVNLLRGHRAAVATGSIYTHTLHIANLPDYASGNTLASDWVRAVAGDFASDYSVPLLNTEWTQLADYTRIRDAHFAALASNVGAAYHPDTNTITLASAGAATVIVTGATAAGATTCGTDHQSTVVLAAGVPVSVPASPRP